MVTLRDFLASIELQKTKLGMRDTDAMTESMRNKGTSRTLEKRELLRRVAQRAKEAGKKMITSYY
jgi:flavin-dependent dehydrogenase